MDLRLGLRVDRLACCAEGLEVKAPADDDFGALLAHEVDRRRAHAGGEVHGAAHAEGVCGARSGEPRVPARRDDEVHVGAIFVVGVLREVGHAPRLEGLARLEGLWAREWCTESIAGHYAGACELLTSNLR